MTPQSRDRGLEWFTNLMARWVPDAITAAVILTFLTLAVALARGNPFLRVIDAYHQGLWMLLGFTMQMTLILVLSLALASTTFFRRAIARLARVPNTRNQFIVLAFLSAGSTAYVYWGLGYALNPMIAIYFATEAERKGVEIDFPFLLAVTTGAQALWQYGLSSSAPLLVASQGHFLQSTIGVIPLSTLGAERPRLVWMVLQEVLVMAAVGLAIGLPVAATASHVLETFLFRMKPNDPLALAAAAAILLAAAVLAGYGPARRASRVDPWTALRDE